METMEFQAGDRVLDKWRKKIGTFDSVKSRWNLSEARVRFPGEGGLTLVAMADLRKVNNPDPNLAAMADIITKHNLWSPMWTADDLDPRMRAHIVAALLAQIPGCVIPTRATTELVNELFEELEVA